MTKYRTDFFRTLSTIIIEGGAISGDGISSGGLASYSFGGWR
jgi:hypothetical protein